MNSNLAPLDQNSWQKLIEQKTQKQKDVSMKYFWASFTLHLIVYGFLSNILIRYWQDSQVMIVCAVCFLLYIPFTVVLMRKFKRMAVLKVENKNAAGLPIKMYVEQQYNLLTSFYRFKKKYELILIPLSSIIFIWILFRLYLPGGVLDYPVAAFVLFLVTITSSVVAIISENKKRFKNPIDRLEEILRDFDS